MDGAGVYGKGNLSLVHGRLHIHQARHYTTENRFPIYKHRQHKMRVIWKNNYIRPAEASQSGACS